MWTAERGSKTRQGLEGGHQRQFCPKAFATGTNRCPVLYYKLFKARRPQKANSPESPFYLAVNHQTWRHAKPSLVQVLITRQERNREIYVHGGKKCRFSSSKQEDIQSFRS